jgi:glycosyltransferase involved in cell wall biosynthesis
MFMNSGTQLTFAICTLNRVNFVTKLVDQLANQIIQFGAFQRFKIIIIDNGSIDHTSNMMDRLIVKHSNVQISYYLEETIGLSNARNTAIRLCETDWIWFLDDEVKLPESWVRDLQCFDFKDDFDFISVSVFPYLNNENLLPCWFNVDWERRLNGSQSQLMTDRIKITGASFCVRKSIFLNIGLFNPDFGFKGKKLVLGEERELISRYRNSKYFKGCFYSDELYIYQYLIEEKLGYRYRLKREFYAGVLTASMNNFRTSLNLFSENYDKNRISKYLREHFNWNYCSILTNITFLFVFVLGFIFRKFGIK